MLGNARETRRGNIKKCAQNKAFFRIRRFKSRHPHHEKSTLYGCFFHGLNSKGFEGQLKKAPVKPFPAPGSASQAAARSMQEDFIAKGISFTQDTFAPAAFYIAVSDL